jgi:hypothetical protein
MCSANGKIMEMRRRKKEKMLRSVINGLQDLSA